MSTNDQNLVAFESDLVSFAELLDIAPAVVMKRIVFDLHGRVTRRTPVDTGRARASWDVKQGAPSGYVPPIMVGKAKTKGKEDLGESAFGMKLGTGAKGGVAGKDISAELSGIDGKHVVFITTNLEYMQYLENGSSKQAPAGMVRISVAEIEIEIESIVEQLGINSIS